MLLKGNLRDYLGSTNDERVACMLKEAVSHNFDIIPFIASEDGRKGYSIFKIVDGQEEGYYPTVDNWIEGFPKAPDIKSLSNA